MNERIFSENAGHNGITKEIDIFTSGTSFYSNLLPDRDVALICL